MLLPAPLRILFKGIVRIGLVMIFAGIPATLVYLKMVGFGDEIRDRVALALSSGPIETQIGRLSFDGIEGLIAEDVKIYRKGNPPQELASIDRVAVAPNLSELLSGKILIDRVSLLDADAQIPVGSVDDPTMLSIGGLRADLEFFEDEVRIGTFEADFQGISLRISGSLSGLRDLDFAGQESGGDGSAARNLLDFLASLNYPGKKPLLTAEVSGSVANAASLNIDFFALQSGPIVAEKWTMDSLEVKGRYQGGRGQIEYFMARDATGHLRLWATGNSEAAEIEIDSTLSLEPFLNLLPEIKELNDLTLRRPPALVARASLDFTTRPLKKFVSGSVALRDFDFRGVPCESFASDFAWDGVRVFVRGAELHASDGSARIDALVAEDGVRIKAEGSMMPHGFAPALDKKTQDMLAEMEFADIPSMRITLRGPSLDFRLLKGTGELTLGRTAMRGVWIDSVKSAFEVAEGAITYRDFLLRGSGNGRGTGTFTYDFAGQQVRLKDIVSTINPVEAMMWVDPRIAETLRPYRFRANPSVRGGGTIFMKQPTKNNLSIQVESAKGLDYDLFHKTLHLGKTSATVDVIGTTVKARVHEAELMGGKIQVNADISIDPKKPVFGAEVSLFDVDFARLSKLYFGYEGSEGEVSGQFSFQAPLKRPSSMVGKGTVRVEDGNVFAIPVLGPLSEIINKILPGAGYETARLATADFSIAEEKIHTKNFAIEGVGFTLLGEGDIYFMTDQMDMSVRINARGMPGLVLFPVSKLFEYVSTGTISKPEWRPKIIPRFGTPNSSR